MKLETLEYKRLVRMTQLALELQGRLPALASDLVSTLGAALDSLKGLTAALASAVGRKREQSRAKKRSRRALRSDLTAIARTAGAIALESPGLDPERFPHPPSGDQRLLTAARAAVQDAAGLEAAFIAHAMPADFLQALTRHIRNFEQARRDYAAALRACEDARARIEASMRQALPVAKRLDAIVRNTLGDDPPALRAWEKACELGRARVSPPARAEDAASSVPGPPSGEAA